MSNVTSLDERDSIDAAEVGWPIRWIGDWRDEQTPDERADEIAHQRQLAGLTGETASNNEAVDEMNELCTA